MARDDPVRRMRGGMFELRLDAGERDVLRGLPDQLRDLIEDEDPSSDPAMARLYPPAYLDDPIRNLEFEEMAGDDLTRGRLAAIERMKATVDAERLSEDDLLAWLSVSNDLRLVLGTRLEITEEPSDAEFPPQDPRAGAFALYAYLTWLVDAIVQALSA
jgi:hypothetical protein